jgi:hypothetical protein
MKAWNLTPNPLSLRGEGASGGESRAQGWDLWDKREHLTPAVALRSPCTEGGCARGVGRELDECEGRPKLLLRVLGHD